MKKANSFPRKFLLMIVLMFLGSGYIARAQHKFEPSIASLKYYECPEWFRDAKFGIYIHWGVYSVAEYGEWYAKNMYVEGWDETAFLFLQPQYAVAW